MALRPTVIVTGVEDVKRTLRDIRDEDAPFVNAYALTKTGQDIKSAEYQTMQSVFDRPTRWALNGLQLRPATKKDPQAIVDYRYFGGTPAERYLGPQVDGGRRTKKAHEKRLERAGILKSDEYVVPGAGQRLDASGNMRGSDITRILSQVGAADGPGHNANASDSKRSKRKRKVSAYFVLRGAKAPNGIYRRTSAKTIEPILMFVKAPHYKKRFPFYEVGRITFDTKYIVHARAGWARVEARRNKRAA